MATPSEVVGIVRPSRLLVLECGRMTLITNLFDSEGEPTEDVYEAMGAVAPCPQGGWYSVKLWLIPDITVH